MIWTDLFSLIRLFQLFFYRKVFSAGALRNTKLRGVFFLVLFSFGLLMTLLFYLFFGGMINADNNYILILNIYSVTVYMCTVVIFLIMKILFLKATDLLKFTFQLPVSNNIRRLSLTICEMIMSLLLICLIASPIIIALVLKTGILYLSAILTNVLFVTIAAYVVFNFIYLFVLWLLYKLKIIINTYLISLIILGGILVVSLSVYQTFVNQIIVSYMDNSPVYIPVLIFYNLAEQYNLLSSFLIFFLFIGILTTLTLLMPINDIIEERKYQGVLVTKNGKMSIFKAHIMRVLRLRENLLLIIISLAVYILIEFLKMNHGIFIFLLLAFNSVYAVVQTDSLRFLAQNMRIYSPKKDYLNLLISNAILVFISATPAIIYEIVSSQNYMDIFLFISMGVIFILFMLLLGILFPPKHDNPFSIILGSVILFSISGLIFVIMLFLRAKLLLLLLGSLILISIIIYTSIKGLSKLERSK